MRGKDLRTRKVADLTVSQWRELEAGEVRIISVRGFNYVIRRRMETQRNTFLQGI